MLKIDKDLIRQNAEQTSQESLFASVNAEMDGNASGLEFFDYDLYVHGLTQSLMGREQDCERKFRLATMGLTSPGESSAIVFGNVFHSGLEIIQNMIRDGDVEGLDDVGDKAELVAMSDLPKEFEEEYNSADAEVKEYYEFAFGCCAVMLPIYFKFWEQDFFGDTKKDWIFSEDEFNMKFLDVPIRGKMDGAFRMNGRIWLLENKTKGTWNEFNLGNAIERDLQVNLYTKALEGMFPDEEVAGVLYNLIRRPQLRRKKDETMKAFIERIARDVSTRPEWYFVRLEVPIPKEQRRRFEIQLKRRVEKIKQFFEDGHTIEEDLENTAQCHSVYGACPYLRYCSSGCKDLAGLNIKKNLFSELSGENQGK